MADKLQFLRNPVLNRDLPVHAHIVELSAPLINGSAVATDRIQLMVVTRRSRLHSAHLAVDATLGAGTTLKLQRDRAGVYTDLTGLTTAGAASIATSSGLGSFDLNEGDIITALVGTANITAAAGLLVDLLVQGK